MKIRTQFNYDLLLLISFCLLINIPYFDPKFMVGHDTKNIYTVFHFFYNHFVWYSELPNWLPYGEYGYSSLWYQISNFTPCSYLIGLIGLVFGCNDTLSLFKLTVVGDQLLFVFGMYLLSERLFQCRYTRLTVCFCAVGSVVWHWQLYWDLRLYYLIPLALYFYHRFLVERLAWAFWATLLTMAMELVGGLAYWTPVYLFLFIVLNVVLLPQYWRSYYCLLKKPGWCDLFLIIAFVSSLTAIAYIYATCLDGLHNLNPGRSPDSMRTLLKIYLTYSQPLWGGAHAFLDGTKPNIDYKDSLPDDMTLYVGLVCVAGLVIAIARVKAVWFYALLGSLVSIVLVAGSGLFSLLAYQLMPGMDVFRHLSLLMEIGKILLLLAGGYGLEIIFRNLGSGNWLERHYRFPHLLFMIAGLAFILDMVASIWFHRGDAWLTDMMYKGVLPDGGLWIVFRLAVWAAFLVFVFLYSRFATIREKLPTRTILQVALVFVCVVDIWTFQMYQWHHRVTGEYAGMLPVEPLQFKGVRNLDTSKEDIKKNNILGGSFGDVFLSLYSNALQTDPCMPFGRMDVFSKGVFNLLSARGDAPTFAETLMDGRLFSITDKPLANILGCETSKIRIVKQALFEVDDVVLKRQVAIIDMLDSVALLRGVMPKDISGQPNFGQLTPAYKVTSFNANRLALDVDVKAGQSGWLIYADAFDNNWKAYINGREVPIYEAYLAFKAIYVKEGINNVVFEYKNGKQLYAMNSLIFVGIVCALLCFFWLTRCINKRQ